MKTLLDGTQIPDDYYYYLLGFRDSHFDSYTDITKIRVTNKICEYTISEFLSAFKACTDHAILELEELKGRKENDTDGR